MNSFYIYGKQLSCEEIQYQDRVMFFMEHGLSHGFTGKAAKLEKVQGKLQFNVFITEMKFVDNSLYLTFWSLSEASIPLT